MWYCRWQRMVEKTVSTDRQVISNHTDTIMQTKEKQKRILIIDDEENMRHMLQAMPTLPLCTAPD